MLDFSLFSMVSCVTAAHQARKTWPCRKMWQKTWERIPQFFSRPFSIS